MYEPKEVEVWIVMDANGDFEVGGDRDQVMDWYAENIGGGQALRVAKITVTMCPPKEVDAEVSVTVPDQAGEVVTATA